MAYVLRTKDDPGDIGRAADQNQSVDNDIYFNTLGTWQTWDPTPIVGYSVLPTDVVYLYCLIGKLCFLMLEEFTPGTSNSTILTYTLPFAAKATANHYWAGRALISWNNGGPIDTGCGIIIPAAPTLLSCYTALGGTGWAAANGKALQTLQMFYEIA